MTSAIAMVDQYGLTALSMRQLGRVLGVEAMALYHHVNGREDLLEAMVAQLVPRASASPRRASPRPRRRLAGVPPARRPRPIRAIAVDHPQLFPLVSTRPPAAPWLRPPLRNLALVEDFLDGLIHRGLSEDNAVHVYKAFTGFLLGHLLLEVVQAGAPPGPPEEPLDEGDADVGNDDQQLDLDAFPTLLRLKSRLRRHDADADFENALEALLDRLDLELSQ